MRALGLSPVKLTFAVLAAAAVAVALLLLSGSSSTQAGTCDAGRDPCVDNSTDYFYSASVADTSAGADRALTYTFGNTTAGDGTPQGNINFGNLITFDAAATVTQGCNITPDGSGFVTAHSGGGPCLKAGETAGSLTSKTTLGTLNSLCFTTLTIDFTFYSVALPNNLADPDASTNIAYTQPEGTSDRFGKWDTSPLGAPGGTPVSKTGVIADADNIMFKNYPQYLLDLFRDTGGTPIVPKVVYGGLTRVAGTTDVPLFLVIFDPGQLNGAFAPPNPLGQMTTAMGFPSQTVLNDPTAVAPNPSSISAFCATTSTTSLLATVGGISRATNPGNGTGLNLAWTASQRDLDNDGIENALDTCVSVPNIDGDPRASGNDPDGDMLDSACDTVANGFLGPGTFDGDQATDTGWYNTQDTCPLITAANQGQSEGALGVAAGYAAGRAADGGGLSDAIGDPCDSEIGPLLVDYNGLTHTITPSDTIANGRWAAKALVSPICYGTFTDADGDGYCKEDTDAFDTAVGDNALKHNAWTTDSDINAVLGITSGASAGSWDTDGGGADISGPPDSIADLGYDSDFLETYLGTDARQPCALSTTLSDEPTDSWIFDTNDDQKATLGDVLAIAPVFLQTATTDAHKRFDWNADGSVGLSDVLAIAPVFLKTCWPVVAPQ